MVFIYYNGKNEKNAVTYFYMNIIESAIRELGVETKIIFSCPVEISNTDSIVTLGPITFWKAYRKHPKHIFNWFQGISPEEYNMRKWNIIKKTIYFYILTYLERFALGHSDINFFVSYGMLKHYRKKYFYEKNNYIVMPCLNEAYIHEEVFNDSKYSKPIFAYTGEINEWQCFEEMVYLFKQIKEKLTNAELRIYSRQTDLAKSILKSLEVKASVNFVPQNQLKDELKDVKYGFIIRKNIAVNNVASPTKMSTYLANGIIPIFSMCIGDYENQIGKLKYSIPLGDAYEGLNKIFELEKEKISSINVKNEFESIFKNYYNSDKYKAQIYERLRGLV